MTPTIYACPRYREHFTAVYKKVCEIRGSLADAERVYLRKVSFAGSSCSTPHITRCIERYYNKHRQFPDFHDVRDLIIKANKQENIQMLPGRVHSIAETCFKEFGEMLKRLRQHDDYLIAASYLPEQSDPAKDDSELQEKLHKNFIQRKRVEDVIDKFAKRQDGLVSDDEENNEDKGKNQKRLSSNKIPQDETKQLSNNDSSNDDDDDVERERHFNKKNRMLSSSSSGEESTSKQHNRAINKGKSLIGKKRLVKGGTQLKSTNNSLLQKVSISSDESSEPKNTKDNFTNYLGLQGTLITDDDEIADKKTDVKYIRDNEKNNCKEGSINTNAKLSLLESQSSDLPHIDVPINVNGNSDDSDISGTFIKDSMKVIENSGSCTKAEDSALCKRENINRKRKRPEEVSLYSSSEESDESSDYESKNVKSGEITDIDLSEDSDEKEETRKPELEELDGDEPVVILSEEVPAPNDQCLLKISPARIKRSEGSSDSDEIIILSQDSDMSNVKIQPTLKPKKKLCTVINPERRYTHPTPGQSCKPQMKRLVSDKSSSGIVKKQKRIVGAGNSHQNMGNNQLLLPRLLNGTARKTFRNAPPPVPKVVDIPVIELD